MNKLFLINLFFIVLILIPTCRKSSNAKDASCDIEKVSEDTNQKIDGVLSDSEVKVDYDISPYIFNELPQDSALQFIEIHREEIGKVLLRYYGEYSTIDNVDSIVEVMAACNFSSKANKELISFYIHILSEILKNDKRDGYIGEYESEICFELFTNYPGFFYQHITHVSEKVRIGFVESIIRSFYYNNINEDKEFLIFKEHGRMLPQYKSEISLIANMIKKYKDKLDLE